MTSRTALVVGGTGLVGAHCLDHLLATPGYDRIVSLVRRASGRDDPKLDERIVDFDHLSAADCTADDVFCCLGTTMAQAGSRERFEQVDYGYPLAVAEAARVEGAEQYLLVSSIGASPDASTFYLRVKGKLEAALDGLGFAGLHLFRPSLLLGARRERRTGEAIGKVVGRALSFTLVGGLRRYKPIEGEQVARAMVSAARGREPGRHVYEWRAIVELATR